MPDDDTKHSTEQSGDHCVILGVSADYHDAAAAVVVDGRLVAAAEEERFTCRKHDPSLPVNAISYCLEAAEVRPGQLDRVAFYDKPLTAYERSLATHARVGPAGLRSLVRTVGTWSRSRLFVGYRLERALARFGHPMPTLVFAEHHQSHAASAFYPSPFERAVVLTFDGVGEWATTSIARGLGHRLEMLEEIRFPNSLGLLYSTVTAHCGFEVNDGEFKLMGLAPYGEPRFEQVMRDHLIAVQDDGSFHLNQRWFSYRAGERMGARRLADIFDGPPRPPDEPLGAREADLASSVQAVLEDIVLRMAGHAHGLTGEQNACLAGGVALNCVANRRLVADGPFDDLWIQPAAGDSGGAVGAALWAWHQLLDRPRVARRPDGMSGAFLGPAFGQDEIEAWLTSAGASFSTFDDQERLVRHVAERLASGEVVGWFQGRMEFGPRALGHRSILADPRDVAMIARINAQVKEREGFRPFAPAVLAEHASEWFELGGDLPYMLVTAPVVGAEPEGTGGAGADRTLTERLTTKRSRIPACTHVDGSARVGTVSAEVNPELHSLLTAFYELTGCPALLNTSFNRRGEPIVRSPADAMRCFVASGLDLLVLERCTVDRPEAADRVLEVAPEALAL